MMKCPNQILARAKIYRSLAPDGGVHLGQDVTREELLGHYDAVVYATGAMRDRQLGIPGEDLPGSVAATDFVNWYCGHPDVDPGRFTLDAESVAVIGVGATAAPRLTRALSPRDTGPNAASIGAIDRPKPHTSVSSVFAVEA